MQEHHHGAPGLHAREIRLSGRWTLGGSPFYRAHVELADLHRHLDGSLRLATVEEFAAADGVALPPTLRFRAGMGLEEALACFDLTLRLLRTPERVERVAAEICEDAAKEGVTTLEIRFAPQLHTAAPLREIVDAASSGIAGRAGLILCGLYGEPPAVLDELVAVGSRRSAVVGIDLAGAPLPEHRFSLADYEAPFARARAAGLGRTVHAAEGRPPSEIRTAVEVLGATRIGHGTTLLEDPSVLDLVLEREVTIEACPTSNVHTSAVPDLSAHPLPRWHELGVRACVNSDNTLFSDVDARGEHDRAGRIPGMNDELLARAVANGHAAAFDRARNVNAT